MSDRLQRLLSLRPWLLADGATGTNLFEAGLQTGDAPELWNFEHPDRIETLHRSMIEAGSDIVLTNSFGGSRHRLKLHKWQDRVQAVNETAAKICRGVVDAEGRKQGREMIVAGSIGPTGELFEPLGPLTVAEGAEAFAEQAKALADGGVDVLWIETMSSKDEVAAAVQGAGTTGLPIVTTLSFDTNGRTMMGVTAAEAVAMFHGLAPRPLAYGANCGVGAAELVAAMLNMSATADAGDVMVAKGNCGFGPVAAIMKVASDDEAIRLMNDNPFGLTAAIWTMDEQAAIRIGDHVDTGTWFMNRCDYLDPALAWVGVKESGRGCTLSRVGYEFLTRPKSFHLRTSI